MDLSPVCFPVPPRAICSCAKQLLRTGGEIKESQSSWKAESAWEIHSSRDVGIRELSPWAAAAPQHPPQAGTHGSFPVGLVRAVAVLFWGAYGRQGDGSVEFGLCI